MHLNFAADSADATVFCYIEDVAPDSSVTYITEGGFRPVHRKPDSQTPYKTNYPTHTYNNADAEPYKPGENVKLVFDLLPISYEIKAGHKLRVSIAGTDAGHFNLPSPKPMHFQIMSTGQDAWYIDLPVSAN